MALQPAQLEGLQAHRASAAAEVQAYLDTPLEERPTKAAQQRAWLKRMEAAQRVVDMLDQLINRAERAAPREAAAQATTRPLAAPTAGGEASASFSVPKGRNAEMRVTVGTWQGRRTVDVRVWVSDKVTGEPKPTRKGLMFDAGSLPALIDAMRKAGQHA